MIATALLLSLAVQTADIRIAPTKSTFQPGEFPTFQVRLTNKGNRTINLLDLGDGNSVHWINPHIGWSILPENAKSDHPKVTPAVTLPRCGNTNTTTPEMFRSLNPGKSTSFSFFPVDFDTKKPGKYRIVFYYEVVPNDSPRMVPDIKTPSEGGLPIPLLTKYRSLTPLKLMSNEVRFEIKA